MALFHFREKAKRLLGVVRRRGLKGFAEKFESWRLSSLEHRLYKKWIEANKIDHTKRESIRTEIERFQKHPLISVIVPVYNLDEKWLRRCVNSVLNQLYENWELCIADDGSTMPHIRCVLEEFARLDPRIKVTYRVQNGHISAASNTALELATGVFTVLLDSDDEVSEDALFWFAREINAFPNTALIYSDEDMLDEARGRFSPKFKPDFSRDLLYSLNLFTHLTGYRTEILRKIGGFRIGLEGSQDYDLSLRFIEHINDDQIRHIPRILYHWRVIAGSVALNSDEKPYAHERGRQAIREHFARTGVLAEVEPTTLNFHRVRYNLPANLPEISLILFGPSDMKTSETKAIWHAACTYENLEIMCAKVNDSIAGSLNAAAHKSKGEIICFADAALRPISSAMLIELAGFAIQPKIGVTGAKIVDKNRRVADGGLVLGGSDLFSVAHEGLATDAYGNMNRNILISNYSAVSVSCMAVRSEVFREIGAFDTIKLPNALFDVDLCLRIAASGLRIVLNPSIEIKIGYGKHLTTRVEPTQSERSHFEQKWEYAIESDPFVNSNFVLGDGGFMLKTSPPPTLTSASS